MVDCSDDKQFEMVRVEVESFLPNANTIINDLNVWVEVRQDNFHLITGTISVEFLQNQDIFGAQTLFYFSKFWNYSNKNFGSHNYSGKSRNSQESNYLSK